MGCTKEKLHRGEAALGGWVMIPHPASAELMAGGGFDWLAVDMEHTVIGLDVFENICRAVKPFGCDCLVRLSSCDAVQAKRVLDAGADGIIVPSVNTPAEARTAVDIAKYPPMGSRGASLCRASDFGRNFSEYFAQHNARSIVVVMLEHIAAVQNADAILSVPGIDAAFIGPYDLSASMGLAGQLEHPRVVEAQQEIVAACKRNNVPPGIHVVPVSGQQLSQRLAEGYRFVACGIDTQFIMHGCRAMLSEVRSNA